MMEGAPVPIIQQRLGHGSLATTDRYVNHLAPLDAVVAVQLAPGISDLQTNGHRQNRPNKKRDPPAKDSVPCPTRKRNGLSLDRKASLLDEEFAAESQGLIEGRFEVC